MTPKEKAEKLCMNFLINPHTMDLHYGMNKQLAKQCALIAVDELQYYTEDAKFFEYLEEVIQEIEKL